MINKKRLAMMAVAASMVLPNNLVYLATNTPVFAESDSTGFEGDEGNVENPPSTSVFPEATVDSRDKSGSRKIIELCTDAGVTEKTYTLQGNEEVTENTSIVIPENKKVTIELNGHNIKSVCPAVFKVYKGGTLILKGDTETPEEGKNTVECTTTNTKANDAIIWAVSSDASNKATINVQNGVTLKSSATVYNLHGIGVNSGTAQAQVTVENSAISISSGDGAGIYVQGMLTTDTDKATVELTNSTIDGGIRTGIYQAGLSDVTVKNSVIDTVCGIETRAGTLTVENSVINGTLNKDTEITRNSDPASGQTTFNAGISVGQHTTKLPITVNLKNSKISGNTALSLTNPENNPEEATKKINITVEKSVLSGKKYDLAYTADTFGEIFLLKDTTFAKDEKPKLVEINKEKNLVEVEADPESKPPYTIDITPSETPTTLDVSKDVAETLKLDESAGTLTPPQQETVKTKLQEQVDEAENNAVLIPYGDTKEAKLNYDYNVQKVDSAFQTLGDGSYNFSALVTATLTNTSIVRLMIPLKTNEAGEVLTYEDASATPTSKTFALDVELSKVVGSDGKTLDSKKIKEVLDSGSNDIKPDYDEDELSKFNQITVEKTYVVKAINTPVVITVDKVENEVYSESSTPPTGGRPSSNKKPKPEEPMEPVVGTPTIMYRLYNRLTGEHLYTIDKNERDNLLTSDTWKDEGEGWIAPSESAYPVYRLLNPNNSDHHYTMDKNEFDTLPSYGWVAEGVAFFSADKDNPENVLLHRLYNPNAKGAGSHHYTADTNERDTLVAQGWTYEGLAWAGLPANK